MSVLRFQLFRMLTRRPEQLRLDDGAKLPDVLYDALKSLPSAELRSGIEWHIGNLKPIDHQGVYFRVGRTSRQTVQLYRDGDFTDQPIEIAPYTHAVMDHHLGVCALAQNPRLAKTATGIADRLARLLSQAPPATAHRAMIEAQEIRDPHDFIAQLRRAHEVTAFYLTFSRPNPFDADEDVYKPLQRFAAATRARSGKTEIRGPGLNAAALESVARSAAATGHDAGASVKLQRAERPVKCSLRSNPATMQAGDASVISAPGRLLARIRDMYRQILRGDGT